MIVIADSGASKTDWVCVDGDGRVLAEFSGLGYNPNYITAAQVREDIEGSLPEGFRDASEVHFYGAGAMKDVVDSLRSCLSGIFPEADVEVQTDLLGAARSLLGRDSGFAAILGTGTNSCLYDGREIVANISSLGFILGDEGSGAYIGKRFIRDWLRGDMPDAVRAEAGAEIGTDYPGIVENVYRKPFPNRYCARFLPFIHARTGTDPYYENLVTDAFRDFFRGIVSHYPDYRGHAFNCVGSVAWCFRDQLERVAGEFGMQTGKITKTPMQGLIAYHTTL